MNSVVKGMRRVVGAILFTASAAVATSAAAITWSPGAVGLGTGGPFTTFSFADIVLESYASVAATGPTFASEGFANLSTFRDAGHATVATPNCTICGGNAPYSLYVAFTGTGSTVTGNFNTFSYDLIGATGVTSFNTNASGIFVASGGSSPKTLGSGTLLSGNVNPSNSSVTVSTLFTPNSAFSAFFVSPTSNVQLTVNTALITASPATIAGRLVLTGGGHATITAIPEPEVYAMMLSGLGVIGFAARRRRTATA